MKKLEHSVRFVSKILMRFKTYLCLHHLCIEQLKFHLVHEGAIVGVDEDRLVVHGVIVDKLYVAHAGRPVNVLQPPLYSDKKI